MSKLERNFIIYFDRRVTTKKINNSFSIKNYFEIQQYKLKPNKSRNK